MNRAAQRLALVAPLTVAVLAAGCADAPKKQGGTPKIGYAVANTKLSYAIEIADGFRSGAASVAGVEYVVSGPPIPDAAQQIEIFKQLTKDAKDGVSVTAHSPEMFASSMSRATADGVPLVAVDNQPPPGSGIELFIGGDNVELGVMLADQVIDRLPPDSRGVVVIGSSSPGVPVLDLRGKGARDQFRKRLPQVEVLGPFETKREVEANRAAWANLVKANPTALAFVGTGDADGWNLAEIKRSGGGQWLAGAFDLDPKSLQAVKDGTLLLVSPEHFLKGYLAGRLLALKAKNGKALPKGWIYTPGLAVTQANVDDITKRQSSLETRQQWFNPKVDAILKDLPKHTRPLR